jgi:hypothetical protein
LLRSPTGLEVEEVETAYQVILTSATDLRFLVPQRWLRGTHQHNHRRYFLHNPEEEVEVPVRKAVREADQGQELLREPEKVRFVEPEQETGQARDQGTWLFLVLPG